MKITFLLIATAWAATALIPLREWTAGIVGPKMYFLYPAALMKLIGPSLEIRVIDRMLMEAEHTPFTGWLGIGGGRSYSSPLLEYDSELVFHNSESRRVPVGDFHSRGVYGMILSISGAPRLLIKYRSNCDALDGLHPLMRDFLFRRELVDTGFALAASSLSPPAPMPLFRTIKTDFAMCDAERVACAKSPRGQVRLMLIERPGESVWQAIERFAAQGRAIGVRDGIRILARIVEILEGLHSRRIVHGNVSPGTLFTVKRNGISTLALSSFENSFFEDELEHAPQSPPLKYFDSHWRMTGERSGYREDMWRAVETAAFAIQGPPYMRYIRELNETELVAFKATGFIFAIRDPSDILSRLRLPSPAGEEVLAGLKEILNLVRTPRSSRDAPDYPAIRERITRITARIGTEFADSSAEIGEKTE